MKNESTPIVKSKTILGALSALCLSLPASTLAEDFEFGPLCSAGGCGTAEMEILISSNTLTLTLDNTSPLTLSDNTGTNTPGITGFGFNTQDPDPTIASWTLTAFDTGGSSVTIGGSSCTSPCTGDWVMNTFVGGVSLDFLPTAGDPAQIKGALYNPSATTGFGALPNYTTGPSGAVLTVTFNSAPILDAEKCASGGGKDGIECTSFVRMQNVGRDGAGSLKLFGVPPGDPPSGIPEPSLVTLMGMGLLGTVLVRRRCTRSA